jgi:ATP-dependent protease ClpP protease subunit
LYVHGARGGSAVWDEAVHHTNLPDHCRAWYAHVVVARMSAGRSDALAVPPLAERPEGEGDAVEINIIGDIGQGRYSGNEIAAQIEDAAGSTIVVNINSHGGTVDDGLKIYRALVNHPNAVHVNVTGYAESMAAIIALAGDVRTIASDGRMYLHRPHLSVETAEADDLRKLAARLDKLSHEFAGIVAARTGQSIDIAEIWIGEATYFNAGQAVAVGLCDVVNRDHAPAVPTAPRARFAPINGAYRSIRPAAKSPKLFQYTGKAIKAGEIVRHKGATYVAARATLAAPGCEPENDPDTWERVQC